MRSLALLCDREECATTRIFLALLVSVSAILMSGCSYVDYFMIANESDAPLEVVLKWKVGLKGPVSKYSYVSFDGRKFERLEPHSSIDMEDAQDKYEIRVVVNPKQTLSVHSIYGWPREKIRGTVDPEFRIYQIDMKGSKGEIHLSGEQTWNQFREMNDGYFIVYR